MVEEDNHMEQTVVMVQDYHQDLVRMVNLAEVIDIIVAVLEVVVDLVYHLEE
jgi:hypothetical protein